MSIKDLGEKIKGAGKTLSNTVSFKENTEKYFYSTIIILTALSSFGLGRLSISHENQSEIIIDKNNVTIDKTDNGVTSSKYVETQNASAIIGLQPGGKLVASRTGSKYYFPWCGSVSNIAEKNKIWFSSETEARAKGYTPASNCKGLK